MGGHDLKLPDIPDWRIYRVENVPELVKVQKCLEARGLRYPWLRNEVWKYAKHPAETSLLRTFNYVFCGGLKYGAAAAVVSIIAEKVYLSYIEDSEGGGHH